MDICYFSHVKKKTWFDWLLDQWLSSENVVEECNSLTVTDWWTDSSIDKWQNSSTSHIGQLQLPDFTDCCFALLNVGCTATRGYLIIISVSEIIIIEPRLHFVNFSYIYFRQKCHVPKVDWAPTPMIFVLVFVLAHKIITGSWYLEQVSRGRAEYGDCVTLV